MANRVIILGAGYAGVAAALYLNKHKKKDDVTITLIDKNPYHTLLTELHEVAGNRVDEECIRIPLQDIFRDTDVNVVTDEIIDFHFEDDYLISPRTRYDYDYLILAVGSSPEFYGIDGMEENCFTLWSYEDAIAIREQIKKCFAMAAVESDPDEKKRLLTFVVGGAGFTGVEMIGELAHWVKPLCRQYGFSRDDVRLVLIDMMPRVLNSLDEKSAKQAHKYMEKKLNIEIMLETRVKELNAQHVVTDHGTVETHTMIWTAGISCGEVAKEAEELQKVGGKSCIHVNEMCHTIYKHVYAAGDCVSILDKDGNPYPAMVETALYTGKDAAKNILNDIRGKDLEPVEVKLHGTMVCVGNYFAVSDIMGKKLPVWLSIIMKFMVNAHYIYEILGLKGALTYLKDEVVHRKQDHHFLEKHYTRKMQAWWAFPMRMFLGYMWLYEGITKITQGWFQTPKLAEFLGMRRGYELAADAVSSATAGGLRIDNFFSLDLKIIHVILGHASKMTDGIATSKDMFAKVELLDFGSWSLMPWIINGLAMSSQGGEMFFQIAITVLEILVGLMLLGGAFTFLGGVGSMALLVMFVTTTGIYDHTWWMVFASILVMGGAGRAFGLDHWLQPYGDRIWNGAMKNGRLRLFFRKDKRK